MAKRRQVREEPSRRVQTMTRQERERSRTITIIVGVVVGLAIVALVGAVALLPYTGEHIRLYGSS